MYAELCAEHVAHHYEPHLHPSANLKMRKECDPRFCCLL
jgi:hypothetical protein